MKKILLTNVAVCASIFGLIGCNPAANNTATASRSATNSNIAVAVNSNTNAAPANSNTVSNTVSNTNSNRSSDVIVGVSGGDTEFINKASQGNLAEVQMGGLAITQAKNIEVKAFGQKMVAEHSKAHSELRDLAAAKRLTLPIGVSEDQRREAEKLSKLSGAAFDKEYVRAMLEDHEIDVADYQKQADNGTDNDAKYFASDHLPILKEHLQMIKAISGKIK